MGFYMKKIDIAKIKGFLFKYRRKLIISISVLFFILFSAGFAGYIFLPDFIKNKAEQAVSEQFHRKLSIQDVSFNPFSLSVTLNGVSLSEQNSDAVFASFDELYVNVSTFSVFTFSPIIREIELINPYIHFSRTKENTYNISDFIDMASQPSDPDKEPLSYSIHNIQIVGGKIIFDDLPMKMQHRIEDIQIRLPYISSRSSQVETFIEPYISALIDGKKLELSGKTRPFANDKETVFNLALKNIALPRYMEYLPYKPAFYLTKGNLSVDLNLHFIQYENRSPDLDISGSAEIDSLQLIDLEKKPLLGLGKLLVNLDKNSIFANDYHISKIELIDPEIYAVNSPEGVLNLASLSSTSGKEKVSSNTKADKKTEDKSQPLKITLKQFEVKNARLNYTDYAVELPYSISTNNFNITVDDVLVDMGQELASINKIASNSAALEMAIEKKIAHYRPVKQVKSTTSEPSNFKTSIGAIDINGWSAHVENKNIKNPLGAQITGFTAQVKNISTVPGQISTVNLHANVDKKGSLKVNGQLGLAPFSTDLSINLDQVSIVALQQYIDTQVNLTLRQADVSTSGQLVLTSTNQGDVQGGYRGDFSVNNLFTTDQIKGDPFVRWKTFAIKQMDMQFAPFALKAKSIDLDSFFARLILSSDGRLNLQNILRSEAGGKKSLTDTEENPDVLTKENNTVESTSENIRVVSNEQEKIQTDANVSDQVANSTEVNTKPIESPIAETKVLLVNEKNNAEPQVIVEESKTVLVGTESTEQDKKTLPLIKIDKFKLTNGVVRFTDNFVKPHYTADLNRIHGTVAPISTQAIADVNVKGRVNHAPLTITGHLNPFEPAQLLELHGQVKGIELAQFSSYSNKYIGYGIEKGKLSFDVQYKVENNDLSAENRLILDQLTFGEQSNAKPEINLPVQLAVNLLKDGDGVIDINLPVSGSLNDPEFSVGGIVFRLIVNLIKKAITAPFSLLTSFGGGEELSWIEFAPGNTKITDKNEEKLAILVKALKAKPGLKLDITGYYSPETDKEGLARNSINQKIRELKREEMGNQGKNLPLNQITVNDEEYTEFLEEVYSDADFKKPRNFIGLQKSLPVAEMEKLLIENYPVKEGEFIELANRRANNVKGWLLEKGEIPEERIFIHASKIKGNENTPKVEFSLHM